MRGILGLIVGIVMVAFAAGMIPSDDQPPVFLQIVLTLFGLVLIWASLMHLRLRMKRWAVYNGGRERHGFARLQKPIGEDDAIAQVIFKTNFDEWLISLDLASMKKALKNTGDEVAAVAWLGDDQFIYGLDIDGRRTLPLSAGKPITRELREELDRQSERRAATTQKLSS